MMRLPLAACLSALLFACPPTPPTERTLGTDAGTQLSVALDGGALQLTFAGAHRLTLPLDAFQLGLVPSLDPEASYDPFWLDHDDGVFKPLMPRGLVWGAPTSASVTATDVSRLELELRYTRDLVKLTISNEGEGRIRLHYLPTVADGASLAFLRLRVRADADEGFYGLGEWFDTPNHRGKRRPMQMEPDLQVESGTTENHVVVPLLIGTTGWGLFIETKSTAVFDVANLEPDLVQTTVSTAHAPGEGLTVHLYAAAHPLDITQRYYETTGAPGLPPIWALGPWLWRDENKDQAEVLDDVAKIRALDLATSGLWVDRPYATAVNSFDFDAPRFPQPQLMVDTITRRGMAFALWHTPYLEETAQPMRTEALMRGFFPPTAGTKLNNWSIPFDFTAPGATAWWQQQLAPYITLGVRGFKLDYGEDIVAGLSGARMKWVFSDGTDERTMHFGYTRAYHQPYINVLPGERFLLCRAGKWGSHTDGIIIWPGDLDATLTAFKERFTRRNGQSVSGVGGLPAAVSAALSLAPSGFSFFAADTGGYRHSPPDKETFVRWVEQSAVMPVMQTGDSSSQMPWEYNEENGRDDEALEVYRQFARLHARLFPYFWSAIQRLPIDGRPLVRALGLAHPELKVHPADEYLVGDALLVAPVVKHGARTRLLRLPQGSWRHWFTGHPYEATEVTGLELTVEAPLTSLPLFVKAGAPIAMLRPTIDTLGPSPDADVDAFGTSAGVLYWRVAAGADGSATLYDGSSAGLSGNTLTLTAGSVFSTGMVLELFGVARPATVTIDGAAVTTDWAEHAGGTLTVNVPAGAHTVQW